jgi:hypothetical protein
MLRAGALLFFFLLLGCSSVRKISQWDRRDPASLAQVQEEVSVLRQKFDAWPQEEILCVKDWPELRKVFADRVLVPPCPETYLSTIQQTGSQLNLEDRSRFEEYFRSQCSTSNRDLQEALANMLQSFYANSSPSNESTERIEDRKSLEELYGILRDLTRTNFPLDRWQMANGAYFVPENDLVLYETIFKNKCRIEDQALDPIYQSLHVMEDLARSLPEGDQKKRLQNFLSTIQKIVDKKIEDFFR